MSCATSGRTSTTAWRCGRATCASATPRTRTRSRRAERSPRRAELADPRVLRPAVLGRVDHERPGVERHAREAAGEHPRLAARPEEDERAQVDMAPLEPA